MYENDDQYKFDSQPSLRGAVSDNDQPLAPDRGGEHVPPFSPTGSFAGAAAEPTPQPQRQPEPPLQPEPIPPVWTQPEPQPQPQPVYIAPEQKKGRFWRRFFGSLALAVLALGAGYLGATLATDNMTAAITGAVQDQLSQEVKAYMDAAGGAVLYRSVQTNSVIAGEALNVTSVANLAADSVVEISTEIITSMPSWFGMGPRNVYEAAGSGVILSDNGYILTCAHVVEDASSITVTLKNGEQYEAVNQGSDAELDIAILKIEAENLTPAVLGDSAALEIGSPVVAIGNPLGQLGGTVTAGYISALDRELIIGDQNYVLLQFDAAINGGNSGGGLFNSRGELVGLVNAKAQDIGVEGLGFAIPIDSIKQEIEDLINFGYITSKVALGVNLVDINDQRTALGYGLTELGVYILNVHPNSNASYAGLQVADRIVSMDGEEISESARVVEIIGGKSVGDTIEMVISRKGQEMTVNIFLYGAVPEGESEVATQTSQKL